MSHSGQPKKEDAQKRRLEAIAGIAGALLTLAVLGVLVHDAIVHRGRPPLIVVQPSETHARGGNHQVTVIARNEGDETAAQVVIEGTLRKNGTAIETVELTFEYLSPRSEQRGGLVFANDPAQNDLELRPKSYVVP